MQDNRPIRLVEKALSIRNFFKTAKNTIFIANIDQQCLQLDDLKKFANWLQKTSYPDIQDVKPQIVNDNLEFLVYDSDQQDTRIIIVRFQWIKVPFDKQTPQHYQQSKDYIQKIYYLNVLSQILKNQKEKEQKFTKIYFALSKRPKAEYMKDMVQYYFQKITALKSPKQYGIMYFGWNGEIQTSQTLNKIFINNPQQKPLNKQVVSIQNMKKSAVHADFSHIFKLSFLRPDFQRLIARGFHIYRDESEQIILKFIEPVRKVINMACNGEKIEKDSILAEILQLVTFYEQLPVKQIGQLPLMESVRSIMQTHQYQNDNILLQHDSLHFLQFVSQFKKMFREFELNFRKYHQSSREIKTFVNSIFTLFKVICNISQVQISKIYNFAYIVLQQIETMKLISSQQNQNYLSQQIIDTVNSFKPDVTKFLDALFKCPITNQNQISYYEKCQKILRQNKDLSGIPNQYNAEYTKKILNFKFQLEINRGYRVFELQSGKSPKKIARCVYNMLDTMRINQNRNQSISSQLILRKCAAQLRLIDQPGLAIEIYKYLKMYNKIQELYNQHMLAMNEKQKGKYHLELAQYYRENTMKEMAIKHAQQAYEQDPELLDKLIEEKKLYLSDNTALQNQQQLLNKYSSQKRESYFDKPMSKEFYNDLKMLSENLPDKIDLIPVKMNMKEFPKSFAGIFDMMKH